MLVGVIDVASERVETPEEVAGDDRPRAEVRAEERLYPCTNCGMAPMARDVALAKLKALAQGATLAQARNG